jgi:hypothetical protein
MPGGAPAPLRDCGCQPDENPVQCEGFPLRFFTEEDVCRSDLRLSELVALEL